jgi:hypothetical protein
MGRLSAYVALGKYFVPASTTCTWPDPTDPLAVTFTMALRPPPSTTWYSPNTAVPAVTMYVAPTIRPWSGPSIAVITIDTPDVLPATNASDQHFILAMSLTWRPNGIVVMYASPFVPIPFEWVDSTMHLSFPEETLVTPSIRTFE